MPDKVLTYQSIEFSRMHSGGIERERAGNRVQLEDSTGNPYTASSGVPIDSSVIGALADTEALAGNGSIIALLKALRELHFGDGILSATANNVLKATGAALQLMSGTVWGVEV